MKVMAIKDIDETKAYSNPAIKKHVILSSGELGEIAALAQATFPLGEVSKAHAHENMGEVFFVISGRGVIRINNVAFELTEGVCAVAEPKEVHEIENTGDVDLKIIYFEIIIGLHQR